MVRYLTTQEVLYVHERLIERTGGTPGVRDVGLLDSILNRPKAVTGGVDVHPTLSRKGAVLMYSLVLNHLFIDGNKRTGLVCLDVFLRLNQVRLGADTAESLQFLIDVADETATLEQMAGWIEAHSQPDKAPAPEARRRTRTTPTRRLTITAPDSVRLVSDPEQ